MQINLLKQIVERVVGEPGAKLVELLSQKKDINEFLIAKKLGLTINQTRNLLYKLSHLGILSSIRKKDKRKGWYIYFWTLNVLRSLEILEESLKEEIGKLKTDLLSKQSKRYYKCKICGAEILEENAIVHNFICPECGEVYELSDNTSHITSVMKNIAKFKKELEIVARERVEEQLKQDKKLSKIIKKVEKDKKDKRQAKLKKTRRDAGRLKAKEIRVKNSKKKSKKNKTNKKSKKKKKR